VPWYLIQKPNGKVVSTDSADKVIACALAGSKITRIAAPKEACGCPRCRAKEARGGA